MGSPVAAPKSLSSPELSTETRASVTLPGLCVIRYRWGQRGTGNELKKYLKFGYVLPVASPPVVQLVPSTVRS